MAIIDTSGDLRLNTDPRISRKCNRISVIWSTDSIVFADNTGVGLIVARCYAVYSVELI